MIATFYWKFIIDSAPSCLLQGGTPAAHGSSQARGLIKAAAAGLHHSHSNARSELCLQPTLQLTATLDPAHTEQGQGSNPHPHGYSSGS